MGDKEDYLTPYRMFFEKFAATVNPEDQLPVNIAGYTIAESELTGEVLYWVTQYLTEKQCPLTLMTPLRRIVLEEVQVAAKKYPNEFGYKSEESVYIALRLMQAVTARVNNVCLRYLDNSRLDSLPAPPPLDQRDLKTGSCATKNSRRVMEDRHVEIGNLEALFGIETTEPTSFYAVYDGHAGTDAAIYCAAHLHQYLVESPHFTSDLTRAMREAFLRTDAEFIRKSNQKRVSGGSTAVVVTVRGKRLLAAWAGDSLALLAKRMRLMQLVRAHKPSRQDERDRIEKSGGSVLYWGTWRVDGQLAVSRAVGDAQYKPYVTAKPEIATVDLDGDEDFVVVASDGLWDFVSEDDVALSVYRQIAEDPDDLKAVTKRLILQAKRQNSSDNISIIVVFLKDPRDIAADNPPPMDLGLDNALANAQPFAGETEACKRPADSAVSADAQADETNNDNGVENSDSDSEDLGPETAVDADDIDADRNHEPAAPTPPVHAVDQGHGDGVLVDNVADSGDESEDEWNYIKGQGEGERNPSEEHEPTRSDTPCQDNSAWETSSVDMNSSPLNPDAPVFIPGSVAGSDVLLAESPRKPLPMDDIELPDVKQFETEAVVRPAELLDLDNCDQLNGHHNASIDIKEHLNGNDKCMDSLGFGFNVGIEPDKVKDSLIQDFERIQKDTTDFCNIQVFQTNVETNPFAVEGDDELLERLKNKERDPMSMSFYQEKDDDTCERVSSAAGRVDLNAVQQLPDSDDDDLADRDTETDADLANGHREKENISPHEPNNDIINFHDHRTDLLNNANFQSEFTEFTNNVQPFSNIDFESNVTRDTVLQTDTPESHKLLFEQIPEIPDGKSSELGFTNDDFLDPSESEREGRVSTPNNETSEEVDESKEDQIQLVEPANVELDNEPKAEVEVQLEKLSESEFTFETECETTFDKLPVSPAPEQASDAALTPEPAYEPENIEAEIHEETERAYETDVIQHKIEKELEVPQIQVGERLTPEPQEPEQAAASPLPREPSLPRESPLPTETCASPIPTDASHPRDSPLPAETLSRDSPMPTKSPLPHEVALPAESPLPSDHELARDSPILSRSPLPQEALPSESPLPSMSPLPREEASLPTSPLPVESPLLAEVAESQARTPLPEEIQQPMSSPAPVDAQIEALETAKEPTVAVSPAPEPAPTPLASPLPAEREFAVEPERQPSPAIEAAEPASSAPAPDLLSDQVTDLDASFPESRAQEICVPVTSEICPEDGERPAGTSTPPPTPAVEPLAAAPLAAAAVAAAAAVGAAAAAKTKTPAPKKPSTPLTKTDARTPKSALKPAAPRTPLSATKRPATAPATRTSLSATRPAPARTSATKPAEKPKAAPVAKTPPPIRAPNRAAVPAAAAATAAPKPAAPAASKPAPKPAAPAAPKPRVALAPRPAAARPPAPKPAVPKTTTATAKPAPRTSTLPSARPVSAPTRPAAAAAPAARKLLEKKPLSNGDVKDGKPAPRPPTARPAAPRAAPIARSAAPKPATRAPLDKQGKDLANKRITAKAAPPRTAPTKVTSTKTAVSKIVPKKTLDSGKKEPAQNGLTNGDGELLAKPPASPPAQDNALLPDVIA